MVVSSRTKLSFVLGLGMIGVLAVLKLGGHIYEKIWPSPEVCCVEVGPVSGEGIVGLLALAILVGSFAATLRSLIVDNLRSTTGSGASSPIPVFEDFSKASASTPFASEEMPPASVGMNQPLIAMALSVALFVGAAALYFFTLPESFPGTPPLEHVDNWQNSDYGVLALVLAGVGCAIGAYWLRRADDDTE